MTFAEFKAWLDGFSEGIGEAPTPEQWAKVRENLAQVYGPLPIATPVVIPSPYPTPILDLTAPWWAIPFTCGTSRTFAPDNLKSWN